MKVGVQIFVTARKAITIESSNFETTADCMKELHRAVHSLQLEQVKQDLICLFGDD